jgi:uncharacterized protein HemY
MQVSEIQFNGSRSITRGQLRNLYKIIAKEEKGKWWKGLRYKNPNVLKQYLESNKDCEADENIVNVIIDILGKQRFDSLMQQIEKK